MLHMLGSGQIILLPGSHYCYTVRTMAWFWSDNPFNSYLTWSQNYSSTMLDCGEIIPLTGSWEADWPLELWHWKQQGRGGRWEGALGGGGGAGWGLWGSLSLETNTQLSRQGLNVVSFIGDIDRRLVRHTRCFVGQYCDDGLECGCSGNTEHRSATIYALCIRVRIGRLL